MLRTLRPHGIDTLSDHEGSHLLLLGCVLGADGGEVADLVRVVEEPVVEPPACFGVDGSSLVVGSCAGALVELADEGHDDHRQQPEGDGADVPRHGDLVQPAAGGAAEVDLHPNERGEDRPNGEREQADAEHLEDVLEFTVHYFPSRDG